jgi:hypothetical protein
VISALPVMALAVRHWVRLPAVQSQVQAVAHLRVRQSVVLVVPWSALQPTIMMAAAIALTKIAMANAIARHAAAIDFALSQKMDGPEISARFVFEATNLRPTPSDLSSAALSTQSLAVLFDVRGF